MYLITMSYGEAYGEYDDHNEIPILITPSKVDAGLIVDDLNENPNSEYLEYTRKAYGEHLPSDTYYSYCELPVSCADSVAAISNRRSKRRFLAEELSCWEEKFTKQYMVSELLGTIASECSWRFVVRIVNRLRRHRLVVAQIHMLNQKNNRSEF